MFCDQCGNEIANDAKVCSVCGTLTDTLHVQQSTNQEDPALNDFRSFGGPLPYQQGYRPISNPAPQVGYMPPPQHLPGYAPASYASLYSSIPINGTVVTSSKNDGAIVAEIVLSLFGVFGVGWLVGGETTIGIILLVCSVFIYWPLMFIGTIFTLGLGLICLGPLAIGAIILNAILCSNALKRKEARFLVVEQPPQMPMPPVEQRPQ